MISVIPYIGSLLNSEKKEHKITELQAPKQVPAIVDYKVTMLIAAEADIRKAVEIDQFVKDKPAAFLNEAADAVPGSHLLEPNKSEGGSASALNQQEAAAKISAWKDIPNGGGPTDREVTLKLHC